MFRVISVPLGLYINARHGSIYLTHLNIDLTTCTNVTVRIGIRSSYIDIINIEIIFSL